MLPASLKPNERYKSELRTLPFLQQNLLYPIDSIPNRPQCHASNIIQVPVDPKHPEMTRLFCAWFCGTREGNLDVGILFSEITYSTLQNKGGNLSKIEFHYGTPRVIAQHPDRACGNPVLFFDSQNLLHLFYPAFFPRDVKHRYQDRILFHKTSQDYGVTWSDPVIFSDRPGLWVKNPLLVLKDGTWLLPINDEWKFNWRSRTLWSSRFVRSSDQGKTWDFSGLISIPKGMIQPCVVQFPSGELYCINRSRTGWIVEMWSQDNGLTWSTPQNSPIPNNNSCACMTQLKDGRLVMIYNPTTKPRTPISIAVSTDQGLHWTRIYDLQTEHGMEFSYPCVIESSDGLIHVVYTHKRRTISHDVFQL